jgi:hypothetical protein
MIDPGLGVVLTRETKEVSMQSVAKQLGAVHAKLFGPALRLGRFLLVDSEAEHCCHTAMIACMTSVDPEPPGIYQGHEVGLGVIGLRAMGEEESWLH